MWAEIVTHFQQIRYRKGKTVSSFTVEEAGCPDFTKYPRLTSPVTTAVITIISNSDSSCPHMPAEMMRRDGPCISVFFLPDPHPNLSWSSLRQTKLLHGTFYRIPGRVLLKSIQIMRNKRHHHWLEENRGSWGISTVRTLVEKLAAMKFCGLVNSIGPMLTSEFW